jgi:NAD(P)-dependent dehydrogenase (short-subunit alcohol dehydrogenase family)
MSQNSEFERVALVTGSNSGIGLATATKLLQSGWQVQLHGLDPEPGEEATALIASHAGRAVYFAADLSAPEAASAALHSAVLANFGRLDALVSNAGVAHHGAFEGVTEAEWLRVLKVNLLAAFFLVRDFTPELVASKGSVVLVSSTNAKRVNHSNMLYDVSKAGLNHLGRALALELRDRGVRVNTVMPGGTLTPMLEDWLVDYSGDTEAARRDLAEATARGHVATPDRVAGAIVGLLNPDSHWVNGAAIEVDGGVFLGEYWSD